MSSFMDAALTRAEMKKVRGGSNEPACRYWYEIEGQGRLYSTYWMKSGIAQQTASNIHIANGGYANRTGWCCESCPSKMPT